MPIKTKLELALAGTIFVLVIAFMYYWGERKAEAALLQATVASQQAVVEQSKVQVAAYEADLKAALSGLADVKRTVNTPTQVIKEIPTYLPALPAPITLNTPPATPDNPKPQPVSATVPAEDLKPIFDTLVQAKECAVRLEAANNVAEARDTQLVAVEKERDAYKVAAKGGTFWHRVGVAAKYVGVGVTIGTIAARF